MTKKVYGRQKSSSALNLHQRNYKRKSKKKSWIVITWSKWLKKLKSTLSSSLKSHQKKRKTLISKQKPRQKIGQSKNIDNQNNNYFLKKILSFTKTLVLAPISLVLLFGVKLFGLNKLNNFIYGLGRVKLMAVLLSIIFGIIGIRLAYIQIPLLRNLNHSDQVLAAKSNQFSDDNIILASRGKIYIQDLARNSTLLVASNRSVYKVVIYPKEISEAISGPKPKLNLNDFISRVSAATNVNYFLIKNQIEDALKKYETQGTRYSILIKEASNEQFQAISNLTNPPLSPVDDTPIFSSFKNYILAEPQNTRTYPEKTMLASTIGFTRDEAPAEDALKINTCRSMVEQNQAKGTENKEGYTSGQYGIERAYCGVLAGVNGKISFSKNGLSQYNQIDPIEGSDITLTIDKNIQAKAEEILLKAIDANSNSNGKPVSGEILVSDVKTGRILASASYPFFDPNQVTNVDYETNAVKNQASASYDPGSVIKPLTIAAARDVYEKGKVRANGKRIGVPNDFKAEDVDEKGLVFLSTDGRESIITNADNRSFKGVDSSLSDILRNSINTLIARIQKDYMDTETTRYYFLEKFKFGDSSDSFLYTTEPPDARNFDKDINSPFSYANMAFGQGFTTTPINLVRAYSALANGGCMVEPRIVENISNVPTRNNPTECTPVIDSKIANEVTNMLQNTLEIGFGNGEQTRPSKAKMDKYTGAAKTGTAQVARPLIKKDKDGKIVKIPCPYNCNSSLGLFDHTYIGYAPASNPKLIILVKLSQPKPGDRNNNYAEFSSAVYWKEIMEYSLGYLGVRPDR